MKTSILSLIIFCLFFANFIQANAKAEIEEDPLVAGWSKDIRISNASGDSLHPSIAMDSKGWVHIVWQDARTGDWKIHYARSMDSGETWEEKVIADQPGSDNTPSIIVDENDGIHVVWSAFVSGEGTEIYYKNSTDGGNTWGEDARLTYASGESHVPKIVA
ncbi:MAG: sialidase family protein, partial [Thermoplasmatales archaeon]|nr:sialidase family protein [Thermoplasmatales archaeon]